MGLSGHSFLAHNAWQGNGLWIFWDDNGNKIQCPMLCLWGNNGFVGRKYDVVKEWRKWATDVQGFGIDCGHYLPEEAPKKTLEALLDFLNK